MTYNIEEKSWENNEPVNVFIFHENPKELPDPHQLGDLIYLRR